MKKQRAYLIVASAVLIGYYFGLSLIRVPEEKFLMFAQLIFAGYFILGFIFGFLFSKDALTNFALVFALGFLGSMLSIVSYNALLGFETFIQALDFVKLTTASFFLGVITAAGTLVNALFVWVRRKWFKQPRRKET